MPSPPDAVHASPWMSRSDQDEKHLRKHAPHLGEVALLDRTFPSSGEEVERWLVEVAASPRRPLVHEARAMLEAEPGVREPATYLSVLGALAGGATRSGEIAGHIGRSADAVSHALAALGSLGLVARSTPVIGRSRPTWVIADPLLRFYATALRPNWEWVERGEPRRLGPRLVAGVAITGARTTFRGAVASMGRPSRRRQHARRFARPCRLGLRR